ncbi:unnamed protein product, partial [Rotaria socialis]
SLKELHLYNNQIGDNGAQRLAEALTINKTLTTLYLPKSISAATQARLKQQDSRMNFDY